MGRIDNLPLSTPVLGDRWDDLLTAGLVLGVVVMLVFPRFSRTPVWGPIAPEARETPVLRLTAGPQQGFAPLKLQTTTRQNIEAVAGKTVCVQVSGPQSMQSCWADDKPAVLVNRSYTLEAGGDYEVQAVIMGVNGYPSGVASNVVAVHVIAMGQ